MHVNVNFKTMQTKWLPKVQPCIYVACLLMLCLLGVVVVELENGQLFSFTSNNDFIYEPYIVNVTLNSTNEIMVFYENNTLHWIYKNVSYSHHFETPEELLNEMIDSYVNATSNFNRSGIIS